MKTPRTAWSMPSTSTSVFERIDLPAVGVALHADVHHREQGIAALDPPGQHDHAGARPEDRHALGGTLPDGLDQVVGAGELGHRRGFAAGDHQAADLGEVVGVADLDRRGARLGQHATVLTEVTLEREDARFHGRQPP